jgi:hypothetical protein
MVVSSVPTSSIHVPRAGSTPWNRRLRRSDAHSSPVDATQVSSSERLSSAPVSSMRPNASCRIEPTLSFGL